MTNLDTFYDDSATSTDESGQETYGEYGTDYDAYMKSINSSDSNDYSTADGNSTDSYD